jgi:transposase
MNFSCGVAPIDCSSGKTTRMRNNKGGNRLLNSVFYSLSIAQKRYNPVARTYYEKKISEGKTPRHARKCLARQLVNIVYKILKEKED